MKVLEYATTRRSVLAAGLAGAAAWMSRPLLRLAHAQTAADIIARSVAVVPTDPDDPAWSRAEGTTVTMNPQNLVLPRLQEAGAKQINVRALYDAERIGFLLEWPDAHRDAELGTVLQYRDGVAVQFPEDPTGPTPPFTMGAPNAGVIIYHWKSDWQFGRLYDVDEAYPNMYSDGYPFSGAEAGEMAEATTYLTKGRKEYLTAAAVGNALADPQVQQRIGPVQKMRAEGFGSLEPHEVQDGQGSGAWRDGAWRIVISVPRRQERFTFQSGTMVPVAFAVWDGSRNERNGQKAYVPWQTLSVGIPAVAPTPVTRREGLGRLVGGIAAAVLVAVAASVVAVGYIVSQVRKRGQH